MELRHQCEAEAGPPQRVPTLEEVVTLLAFNIIFRWLKLVWYFVILCVNVGEDDIGKILTC